MAGCEGVSAICVTEAIAAIAGQWQSGMIFSEEEKGSWLVVCVRAMEWEFVRNVDDVVRLANFETCYVVVGLNDCNAWHKLGQQSTYFTTHVLPSLTLPYVP